MRTLFASPFILISMLILLNFSCKKPDPGDDDNVNWDLYRSRIGVGYDNIILWPKKECWVDVDLVPGTLKYAPNGPLQILWRVISCPDTPLVERLGRGFSDHTTVYKISGLNIGVYEFEVSFDEKDGKFNKDTCRIIVDSLSNPPKEIIFPKQNWIETKGSNSIFPSAPEIRVFGIYDKIPLESAFRAFIKRENNSNWEELLDQGGGYYFRFEYIKGNQGMITIQADLFDTTTTDKPDIKLVY